MSGGAIVNNKVIDFWRYLNGACQDGPNRSDLQVDPNRPNSEPKDLASHMHSEEDRADALIATVIYQLINRDNQNQQRYRNILKGIINIKNPKTGMYRLCSLHNFRALH